MIRKLLKINLFKKIFIAVNKVLLSPFFNTRYLKGYYFEKKSMGWLWAWKSIPFKLVGVNTNIPWPASHNIRIHKAENMIFSPSSINIFQSPGCYYNNFSAKIVIGEGVYIAPNVGIITANHDVNNLDKHMPGEDVIINKDTWIGMNSVILPGVILGEKTIVGAGSVVTKSFPEGNCVIAGNPAKVIKKL
ncbi:acyltransferase [Halobacillus mangrovi]|uniref:acyltransferase n=1 Tax=Halobacillus mangrovi TaxID=402384 RepID=UPI003D95D3C4